MVEAKCVEVDNEQKTLTAAGGVPKLQWQALITLHHTLLHEYHNFFLASQHPSASTTISIEVCYASQNMASWHTFIS